MVEWTMKIVQRMNFDLIVRNKLIVLYHSIPCFLLDIFVCSELRLLVLGVLKDWNKLPTPRRTTRILASKRKTTKKNKEKKFIQEKSQASQRRKTFTVIKIQSTWSLALTVSFV